jgi:transposase
VALLKQIKGVGTLIALTFLLTLEDPHRFRKSRDLGCYLGLQPGRRKSGESDPQMHIRKEGDPYLRTLLVQGAQHILGPFGIDCDLRRWGLKLAERGGRNGKKRAIGATARKLAVLLHHLWVSGEGSGRQGCESSKVEVLVPSIACIRTASISGACRGNEARSARM